MDQMNQGTALWHNPALIREIAVGTAATLLFFMSVLLIPVVGFFVGIFTPLPTLLFFYRWGRPSGYAVPGAAAVIGLVLLSKFNLTQSAPYFLGMLLLGVFLASGMRRQWSAEKTIGLAGLLVFAVWTLTFWLSLDHGAGFFQSLEKDLHATVTLTLQQYGTLTPEKRAMEESFQEIIPVMVKLLPGVALSSALVIPWLNLLVIKRYCRLHRLPLPPWGEWSRWKAPEPLVWPVIAGGILLLLPQEEATLVGLNLLTVLGTVYLFQGLSIVTFYFERWKLPRVLRAAAYAFLLLQQFVTLGAILMGLFDLWFDFRRLTQKSAPNV